MLTQKQKKADYRLTRVRGVELSAGERADVIKEQLLGTNFTYFPVITECNP